MGLLADILLIAGALGAGFYCIVLSRRLSKFTDLEKGVGGAIAVLSAQVDDMTRTLQRAQTAASTSTESLVGLTQKAEGVAQRLELMVASMHDLPAAKSEAPAQRAAMPDASGEPDPQTTSLFTSRRSGGLEAAE